MRIAVVAGFAPSLVGFRGPLLQAMVDAGHEVIARAPEYSDDVVSALSGMGVACQDIPLERTGVNPVHDMLTLGSLKRLFEGLHPDCVLSYTAKPVIYGSLAAGLAGVHKIYSMITGLGYAFGDPSVKQRLIGLPVQALYRSALRRNDAVFFQNSDDQEH